MMSSRDPAGLVHGWIIASAAAGVVRVVTGRVKKDGRKKRAGREDSWARSSVRNAKQPRLETRTSVPNAARPGTWSVPSAARHGVFSININSAQGAANLSRNKEPKLKVRKSNTERPSRMYVRIEASAIKVKYGVVGTRMGGVVRAAKDVGGGGIRFPVNKRLPKGAKLNLELTLPHETVPIQAQAEVIWSARFHGRRTYEAGCQFIKIDPLDRGKIIRHVHEALRDHKPE
jgi:hypothetical protein